MGIPILGKDDLYIEMGPWCSSAAEAQIVWLIFAQTVWRMDFFNADDIWLKENPNILSEIKLDFIKRDILWASLVKIWVDEISYTSKAWSFYWNGNLVS